jgi:hypothetical protein
MDMRRRYVALASAAFCLAGMLSCQDRKTAVESSPSVAPYTAHLTTTTHRILPDGSKWDFVSTEVRARDRKGRTYAKIGHAIQNGGQKTETFSFNVEDPARKQSLTWGSQGHAALLAHWPYWSGRTGCWVDENGDNQVRFGDVYKIPTSPGAGKMETIRSIAEGGKQIKTRIVSENLGQKELHGLIANGMRSTMTPLESGGPNSMPEHTLELWHSDKFDLDLLNVSSGPKYGLKRTELSDLKQGDPDPALFNPPQGYTIESIQYHQVPRGQK